uniref:Uncharacterized protein n=1 Tax=Phytophthora ramorum TaxID=164328 RepID=H3H2K2_PHYRM
MCTNGSNVNMIGITIQFINFQWRNAPGAAAQKRPLTSGELDDSEGGASGVSEPSSLGEWLPSPCPSRVELTDTTSSASENGGQREIVAAPLRETQFPSWETFEAYLAVYQVESFKTVDMLRKAAPKKPSTMKFIVDNSSSNPKPQDVHNLVRKLKTRENENGPTTSAKRLKKWMSEFGDVSENVGRTFVDRVAGKV